MLEVRRLRKKPVVVEAVRLMEPATRRPMTLSRPDVGGRGRDVSRMRPTGLFVTPHALARFKERIDAAATNAEIYAYFMGLPGSRLPDYVTYRPEDPGAAMYRCEWKGRVFTAWVVPSTLGEWPAVVTVIEGDDQLRRWRSWARDGRWKGTKHGRQIRTLAKLGFSPGECARIINQRLARVLRHWDASLSNPAYDRTGVGLGPGRPYKSGRAGDGASVLLEGAAEESDRCS